MAAAVVANESLSLPSRSDASDHEADYLLDPPAFGYLVVLLVQYMSRPHKARHLCL